ncbi:galactoside 2-alpha-L-fucosyltransferase-like [Silene latifolia]|uniref:galactoside 2-alpha-L-fucosyltransferase-like n=1 Tax=Silene latifolia TaxID=37657 RepID=UPI003D7746AF
MKRLSKKSNADNHNIISATTWKCELKWMSLLGISVAFLMAFSGLFSLSVVLQDTFLPFSLSTLIHFHQGYTTDSSESSQSDNYDLLGGLLSAKGFEKGTCLSRYQASLYRKVSSYTPSSYLVSKLRAYERLHQRCSPNTESYNRTLELIDSARVLDTATDCNYLLWLSFSALENRILSISSAFLYAILTDRVLLIDRGSDMDDLFCEPFPDTSWLLPINFPFPNKLRSFDQRSGMSYGNMLRSNIVSNSNSSYPSSLYLHLAHDYDDYDQRFFCDREQRFLRNVPWLIMKTDNYFIPSLFLIPSFEKQLHGLFPQKETVFHFLGRYLFHPTNSVWGLILRYYDAYLSKADEKVGIQIGELDTGLSPAQHVLDEIMACGIEESLLPPLNQQEEVVIPNATPKLKALLITSLNSGYYESIKNMYWEKPAVNGEIVSVYQPRFQQTEKRTHNRKAWAEMYLLSLTDVILTSSGSNFGYVAQGLGGLKPWILYKPENGTVPNPPCRHAMSVEPCFHAPPLYDCKAKKCYE